MICERDISVVKMIGDVLAVDQGDLEYKCGCEERTIVRWVGSYPSYQKETKAKYCPITCEDLE